MNFLINLFILWSYNEFSNHPDEHSVIFWQNVFIRSITTFVPNLKTARPEKKNKKKKTTCVYPLFVHFLSFTLRRFFLVNPRDTGTPKLLNDLPKIAHWSLTRSSIKGGGEEYVRECALLAFWPLDKWAKWVSSSTSLGDFCVESGCTLALIRWMEKLLCCSYNLGKPECKQFSVTFEIRALFLLFFFNLG